MFDGVFIKNLVKELKQIENVRINKLGTITASEIFLTLSTKNSLLISINSNNQNIRLTNNKFINSPQKINFHITLKKYLESSIINEVTQYQNDRIFIIRVTHYDDLGYEVKLNLYIEFFGRNSNIILTHENNVIIDCYKRTFGESETDRVILPKSTYEFPASDKVNPYDYINNINNISNTNDYSDILINKYQGISTLLFQEINYNQTLEVINNDLNPVLIEGNKTYFYAFDLKHLEGKRTYFDSLSNLLEYYYTTFKKDESNNNEQLFLKNYINKEIHKIQNKIIKQQNELDNANNDLKYERLGNLLLSNLYKIKKGDKSVTLNDYYNNYEEVEISLDPLLTPNQNANLFFKKYQKAKRAIDFIKEQLDKSNNDLLYYNVLLDQLSYSKINDIVEIYQELNINLKSLNRPKKARPNITTYVTDNGDYIYVGKNNVQNNYLTNVFAKKTDYFFHVQNVPGSHVILRTDNLTDELIYLTGCIASYYSSYKGSTNVCVDYTLIKNVKKIPGQKGSFVTYKNQKSVFGKPQLEYIEKHTKIKV